MSGVRRLGMAAWSAIAITLSALYFLPAVIYSVGSEEGIRAKMAFALLNGIFSWTVVGWFLLMTVSLDHEAWAPLLPLFFLI
jgi:hypothetical protein